jgi:hypothetical protein
VNVREFVDTARALEHMPFNAFETLMVSYGFNVHWIAESGWPWFHKAPMGFVAHFLTVNESPNAKSCRNMCQELVDTALEWASS